MKQWGLGFCLMLGLTVLFGIFFRLQRWAVFAIGLIGCALVPLCMSIQKRDRAHQQKYYEMIVYMEILLCSFKRVGHIKLALQDCLSVFKTDSTISQVLNEAIHILETGENAGKESIAESALDKIAVVYKSRRINLMHHFLCQMEKKGGDAAEALDILLTDLEMWKRRFVLCHKRKKVIGRECTAASVLALLLCLVSHLLIPESFRMEFEKNMFYQLSTTVVLCTMMGSMTIILYCLKRIHVDQRREKDLSKEVEREFPYWLLSVTLYLQHDSLYHALEQSERETTGRFRQEVRHLVEGIYEAPNSLQPYMNFFKELELPELQTGMKMLYAVTSNEYQDTKRQVHFLIEQNFLVMDRYEKDSFRLKLAGVGMLRQIPMLLAGVKAAVDMITFLMLFGNQILFPFP